MKENGKLTKIISPHEVEITFPKNSACKKCGACRLAGDGKVSIIAANKVGAKLGDKVEVEIATKGLVFGSLLVFVLPIVFLMAGYFLGFYAMLALGNAPAAEKVGILTAFVLFGFSFLLIKLFDNNLQKSKLFQAEIRAIFSN
ncbi:MAG: SoxR reducing system RseC family protein [Candidatus Margulisbacteria bacterium]|nr:SoxR reducing system RseC family protein [Candidatus Margulisiibacteriota bacterium]